MKTGDTDTSFSAHCPKCGGREWLFGLTPQTRYCANNICAYTHYLSGPEKSEVIQPPKRPDPTEQEITDFLLHVKRQRIREIVCALVSGGYYSDLYSWVGVQPETTHGAKLIRMALVIDDAIEGIT